MKKTMMITCLLFGGLLSANTASAQKDEIAQLLLNVEKLSQFKQILSDMKKGYQILEGGYNTVKNISEGNFKLHQAFLDGLLQVSPAVRNYRKVGAIINFQGIILKEYQSAFGRFKRDVNFNEKEIIYLGQVYDKLLKASLRNLNELSAVMTAGQLRMTDDERLKEIDRIHAEMSDKVSFLRTFNNNTKVLAIQRAKEKNDVETIRSLYGIKN